MEFVLSKDHVYSASEIGKWILSWFNYKEGLEIRKQSRNIEPKLGISSVRLSKSKKILVLRFSKLRENHPDSWVGLPRKRPVIANIAFVWNQIIDC